MDIETDSMESEFSIIDMSSDEQGMEVIPAPIKISNLKVELKKNSEYKKIRFQSIKLKRDVLTVKLYLPMPANANFNHGNTSKLCIYKNNHQIIEKALTNHHQLMLIHFKDPDFLEPGKYKISYEISNEIIDFAFFFCYLKPSATLESSSCNSYSDGLTSVTSWCSIEQTADDEDESSNQTSNYEIESSELSDVAVVNYPVKHKMKKLHPYTAKKWSFDQGVLKIPADEKLQKADVEDESSNQNSNDEYESSELSDGAGVNYTVKHKIKNVRPCTAKKWTSVQQGVLEIPVDEKVSSPKVKLEKKMNIESQKFDDLQTVEQNLERKLSLADREINELKKVIQRTRLDYQKEIIRNNKLENKNKNFKQDINKIKAKLVLKKNDVILAKENGEKIKSCLLEERRKKKENTEKYKIMFSKLSNKHQKLKQRISMGNQISDSDSIQSESTNITEFSSIVVEKMDKIAKQFNDQVFIMQNNIEKLLECKCDCISSHASGSEERGNRIKRVSKRKDDSDQDTDEKEDFDRDYENEDSDLHETENEDLERLRNVCHEQMANDDKYVKFEKLYKNSEDIAANTQLLTEYYEEMDMPYYDGRCQSIDLNNLDQSVEGTLAETSYLIDGISSLEDPVIAGLPPLDKNESTSSMPSLGGNGVTSSMPSLLDDNSYGDLPALIDNYGNEINEDDNSEDEADATQLNEPNIVDQMTSASIQEPQQEESNKIISETVEEIRADNSSQNINQQHMEEAQSSFRCSICEYESGEYETIVAHFCSIHVENKCPMCEYSVPWDQHVQLDCHVQVHLDEEDARKKSGGWISSTINLDFD